MNLLNQLLVFLGLAAGLIVLALGGWRVVRALSFRHRSPINRLLYDRVEWVGPLSLLLTFAALLTDDIPSIRPFTFVPLDGSWWEYLVFGLTTSWFGVLTTACLFGPLALVGLALPWKLVSRHILSKSTTLQRVALAAIGVFLGISIVVTLALLIVIAGNGGELVGSQGSLFREGNYGLTALGNTYYFSALAVLGAGFGEYEPTGLCRPVVLATVMLGKVLEIAVIATGVSFATSMQAGRLRCCRHSRAT